MLHTRLAPSLFILLAMASSRALAANANVNVACCQFTDTTSLTSTTTIDAGDTVTWTNMDFPGSHTVTSGTGSADPNVGVLFDQSLASTFTFQFNTSGTFQYFCRVHEIFSMRGTVVVRCNNGDVNTAGTGRQDALTVNSQTGTVIIPFGFPVTVALASSNGGPAAANYALFVWGGSTPHNQQLVVRGTNCGCLFNPTPLAPGSPQPVKCLHSPAFVRACMGRPTLPSPASTPWMRTRPQGFVNPVTFTLQAVLIDNAAGNSQRVSVSNVVILQVQ
ncbi:MAG: hypothetical protein HYR85_14435 [Planctomycetes bacterium]|nr:hypothetical protein [Planctomycetota bacterium]MBI3844063.1 hypothetical protein [Planctomycetota bacterium]